MKTVELIAACRMVTEHHPEVEHLFVSLSGRWLFCDDCFEAPTFGPEIEIDLLETMVDSLEDLPAAFYIPEVLA